MKVIEMGNLQDRYGDELPEVGIVIEATREELGEIEGNIFWKDVQLKVVDESEVKK